MNNYCVYMHISPNDKRYIGLTCQKPEYRWCNGKGYKGNAYFMNAINKYGWDNFQHIIIAKGLTEDEAKWLETELIREWDTRNQSSGYNVLSGGQTTEGENNPFYGKQHTKESIDKMKNSHTRLNLYLAINDILSSPRRFITVIFSFFVCLIFVLGVVIITLDIFFSLSLIYIL